MTVQLRTVPVPEARGVLLGQAGHLTSSQGTALAQRGPQSHQHVCETWPLKGSTQNLRPTSLGMRVFADVVKAGLGSS